MAVNNTVSLGRLNLGRNMVFQNQSVSFTSSAGTNASYRAVPAGCVWVLQTLRGYNGEAAARDMQFTLTDTDGTSHGQLMLQGNARISIPTLQELCWVGSVIIPEYWRVYTHWYAMAGGSTCNWQYTALEYTL